jgi:hypothetical protein
VSSLEEIESAIRKLPRQEQAQLINHLPALLPELEGDAIWKLISLDPRPRPKLNELIADTEARFRKDPASFNVIRDSDFDS